MVLKIFVEDRVHIRWATKLIAVYTPHPIAGLLLHAFISFNIKLATLIFILLSSLSDAWIIKIDAHRDSTNEILVSSRTKFFIPKVREEVFRESSRTSMGDWHRKHRCINLAIHMIFGLRYAYCRMFLFYFYIPK